MKLAEKVAKTDVTVFINGPTGTGKEVLSNSFIVILPLTAHLLELIAQPFKICLRQSCLGMKKGAFTEASAQIKEYSEQLMVEPAARRDK